MNVAKVNANNLKPIASMVQSGSTHTGYTVNFDGHYSYDPDGGAITAYECAVNGVTVSGAISAVFTYLCTLQVGQTSRTVSIRLRVRDDDNGGTWSNYVYKTITISATGRTEYYLTDHLGSIRTTIDDQGKVLGYDDYDPFGNVLPGRSYNAGTPNDLNKFTGHERDQEGGLDLDYMLARNYDSELGRFYSVDPLASKFPAWSPYNYTMNNPLRFIDPDGREVIPFRKNASLSKSWQLLKSGQYVEAVKEGFGAIQNFVGTSTTIDIMPMGMAANSTKLAAKSMLSKFSKKNAKSADDVASSAASKLRLTTQLGFQEAGLLDDAGKLTQKALDSSGEKAIVEGSKLNNDKIIKALTQDGTAIEDWGKFATEGVEINGKKNQIHFYKHKDGKVIMDGNVDFKVAEVVSGANK